MAEQLNKEEVFRKMIVILERREQSKSTDKLIAVMCMLATMDWDKIKEVELNWEVHNLNGDHTPIPKLRIVTTHGEVKETML
jgi:hypothetical protein